MHATDIEESIATGRASGGLLQVAPRWRRRPLAKLLVVTVLCAAWGWGLPPVTRGAAEEPVEAFLEGMRARGMYDVALDYLDYLSTSPLADESTRQMLPYERGVVLVAGAHSERDVDQRMRRLAEAETAFQQFLANAPDSPRAGSASTRLGGILVERGRARYDASQEASNDATRDASLAEARKLYGDADKVFEAAIDRFDEQLAALPKFIDRRDADRAEARQQLRVDLADARLSAANVLRETARTYDSDDHRQHDELLRKAVGRYQAIFDDDAYRSKPVRWYARLQQGWCYEELGEMKEALVACDELLVLPAEPETLARLKAETMHLAMTCWLDERSRDLDQAVAKGSAWLETVSGDQSNTDDVNAVRWLTSSALMEKAAATNDTKQRDAWTESALALADEVAAQPGPYRGPARALLVAQRPDTEAKEPATFADTLAEGQRLLESLRQQAKTDETDAERAATLNRAIALLRRSLKLAREEKDVKIEDVNQARYYLCFGLYRAEQFYDAAVIGEFLAARYADDPQSRPAARIALFALWSAYDRAAKEDREFDLAQMAALAQLIAKQWPDSAEASEAWSLLGDVSLAAGDVDTAIERYSHIPEDSSRRALADLRAGRAIWIQALRAAGSKTGDAAVTDPAAVDAQVKQATELLEHGVEAMRQRVENGAEVSRDLVIGELSLAQVYLQAGNAQAAIDLLSRGNDSIDQLLSSDNEVTHQPGFATEAYKTLLRARIAAGDFNGADNVMARLDKAATDGHVAADDVTRIYLGLGRELEDELLRLEKTGERAQLDAVRESFQQFLDHVAKRPESLTFSSLMWVGDTYIRLGAGMGDDSSQLARFYYAQASKSLDALLARSEKEADFAPSADNVLAVRIKLAECKRHEGDYSGAVRELVEVLIKRPNLLSAQLEAAHTYQAWGKKDPAKYALAVRGDKKARRNDGQPFNLIWGWAKLGNALQSSPEHRDLYYEARYRQAECWYAAAQAAEGDEKKRNLQLAASTLLATQRLTPLSSDDEWYAEYDDLLRRARKASGQSATGLSEASAKRG